MIRLPRLMDRNLQEIGRLDPIDVALECNLAPLTTAEMTLDGDAEAVHVGDFVELYTQGGSEGIFRAVTVDREYGGRTVVMLEHGLTTLSDAMMTGKGTKTGTARELMSQLLGCQTTVMWQLGDVDAASEALTWEYDQTNVLEGLCDLLKQLPQYALSFDQTQRPWVVHLRRLDDADACECRLSRNLSSVSLSTDMSQLCTVLHISGLSSPLEADTIDTWGRVVRSMDADEDIGEALLRKAGLAYLEEHKKPWVTVELDAVDLCEATGESFDRFHLGRMCRVCLPDYQEVLRHRVVSIRYPSVYGESGRVRVTLSHAQESTATAIAGLIVDTTVSRKRITGDLRAQYDLIIAANNAIKLEADRIEALTKEVEINAETILVKADKVELNAYVKATELEAELARFDNMLSGSANIDALVVDAIRCNNHLVCSNALSVNGNFNLAGTTVALQSKSVCTSASRITAVGKAGINYLDHSGNPQTAWFVTDVERVNASTTTLQYVGV